MNGRVALVYPRSNLDSVQPVCQAAELLARAGYQVDVFTRTRHNYVPPKFENRGVELVLPQARAQRRGIHRWLPRQWSGPLQVWERHRALPYRCVIGVDQDGLEETQRLMRWIDAPLAYYSLELMLTRQLSNPIERRLKQVELEMTPRAAFNIIQDEARAKLFCDDNRIPMERVVLVPNAPLGSARRRPQRYWHKQFGLPDNARVLLHAGSIDEWTGIDDIVASIGSWPADWVLVVHTRFAAESSEMVNRLRGIASPDRLFLSLQPVPRQEFDNLLDGADAGIAFYVQKPGSAVSLENIQTIGLSSGKLSNYLKAGLPVIVNKATSVHALIDRERCGVSVTNATGIGPALSAIAADYDGFSQCACEVFDTHLNFERKFGEVIRRIGALPPSK